MDTELNNKLVIQHLLQRADELTNQPFGANSTVTLVGEEQYATAKTITVNAAANDYHSSNSRGVRVEEVDEATANQIIRSLQGANVQQQYQVIDAVSSGNTIVDAPATTYVSASSYAGELYQDPHPPQIIRRPPAQGPITYKQNIAVRFLQPPPVPPPGVSFTFLKLIILLFYDDFIAIDHQGSSSTTGMKYSDFDVFVRYLLFSHRLHDHLSFDNVHHQLQHHLQLFFENDHHAVLHQFHHKQ
jgi:hypothetical protein